MERRRLAAICAIALLLGWMFAPRVDVLSRHAHRPMPRLSASISPLRVAPSAATPPAPIEVAVRPLVGPLLRPHDPQEPDEPDEPGWGLLSGYVVDGAGYPVPGAVLHVHGPLGARAERVADDGEFHFEVREGAWTVEAGWFDGEDEWRSVPTTVNLTPGATATIALEILLNGAAHAVHGGLTESLGVGWEVEHDDGPLRAGDVLVEVGGRLLTDLQPEAVRAALRERPGESVSATVLRTSATGTLEEVVVELEAR